MCLFRRGLCFLLQTSERCICVNAAYSEDLYSVSCRSFRLAGAPLLILFYLRATLNINVVLSLNYSLESLPGLTAFAYLRLPSPPPHLICVLHSTTPGSGFSTLKVNFWWYQMWWLVGAHSSLAWFHDSNPASWAKYHPPYPPTPTPLPFILPSEWHLGAFSFTKGVRLKSDPISNVDNQHVSYLTSDKRMLRDGGQHWNQHDFGDLNVFYSHDSSLLIKETNLVWVV